VISPQHEPKDSQMKLLPHQNALLEVFFNPASKRVILLRGDVGLGKMATLVALAGRLMRVRPTSRVLVLVPAALRSRFVEMLRDAGSPTLLVDRYRFREMLDSSAGENFWPCGMVAVLSLDFAKQPDIRDSLTETHWDLVIVDEAHLIRGARAQAFREIEASADRVVLATAMAIELPDTFRAENTTLVEWRRDQVVDHDGNPLNTAQRPVLHEIPYTLSMAELSLRATVGSLCEVLGDATTIQKFVTTTIRRILESSPAALEGTLQRIVQRLEAREVLEELLEVPEEEVSEDAIARQPDRATTEKEVGIAVHALQEIEAIGGDSKLSALQGLLSDLSEVKMPERRICVLTQFVGTLYYLAAEIEGLGMAYQLLHGGMNAEDRLRSLALFSDGENILVSTAAIMAEGIALPEVTDLILYDIPDRKIALQQLLGRFDRFGRRSQLNVYILTPSNTSDGFLAAPIALLRDLLIRN
jgi:superfamily II DNA or RNA helicase